MRERNNSAGKSAAGAGNGGIGKRVAVHPGRHFSGSCRNQENTETRRFFCLFFQEKRLTIGVDNVIML